MTTRDDLQTPTATFTTLGLLGLALDRVGYKHGQTLAFIGLMLAAGGVAMALAHEVEAHNEPWRWDGILRSLRTPTPSFKRSMLTHLPQLAGALGIALAWRYGGASGRTAGGASRTGSRR